MPGFVLPLLDGTGERAWTNILRDRRGALLVFWSGLLRALRAVRRLLQRFRRRVIPNWALRPSPRRINETDEQMIAAARDRRLSFPILRDKGARIARLWFSQQTPRCYLLDAERPAALPGRHRQFQGSPAIPERLEYLEPAIAQFLNGEPIARADTPSFGCAIETVYYQLPKQL